MSEAVQKAGQERDEAVRPAHPVRGADERVVRVTERSTAWVRSAAVPSAHTIGEEEPAFDLGALGPMPTDWTHDLVHCRLLTVDALARRLPRPLIPAGYRSFLGALQPQEAGVLRRPLTPSEVTRVDWTFGRIALWPERDRAIIMGLMSGVSVRTAEKMLARLAAQGIGSPLKRSGISKRYKSIRMQMAEEWKLLRENIDRPTREAWLSTSRK